MKAGAVSEGDVVQLSPETSNPGFGGCMLVVTEVKAWGVKGYVMIPQGCRGRRAYYRVPWDQIEYVGPAKWRM